jgi:hypothetical protein
MVEITGYINDCLILNLFPVTMLTKLRRSQYNKCLQIFDPR